MSSSVHKAAPRLPGGRLAFERAIRRSSLPAPARHVALTIATWADIATGLIPERFQPSISVLAEATGLSEATVKRHLGVLESERWLERDRPEISRARREHARTKYALLLPAGAGEHGSERAMPRLTVSHAIAQAEPGHGSDVAKAGLTVSHKSSLNPDESPSSPTSSSVDVPSPESPAEVPDGGGGGVSPSRDLAIEIAAALTVGQPVHKQLRETLTVRLAAALDAGWTVDGLAVYLHMGDGFTGSAAAVAAWRLDPERLPAPEPLPAPALAAAGPWRDTADGGMWERAMARANARMASTPRPGTDTAVAGWGDVARQLREHKPYSNDGWHRAADPAAAAKIPWCGHEDCDPVTRLHPAPNPLDKPFPCDDCHPGMQLQQF